MPVLPEVASRISAVRCQRARLLAFEDHPGGSAILDRPAGVLPLGLRVELDARRLALEPVQPDEGRPADQVEHRRSETIRQSVKLEGEDMD